MTIFGTHRDPSDAARRSVDTVIDCALATEARSIRCRAPLEEVLRTAQPVALVPRVASRLSRHSLDGAERAHLDGLIAEATARNALLLSEFVEVSRLLGAHKIETIGLKGVGMLLAGARVEFGERHMDDIDVLVPEQALHRAVGVLIANGYRLADKMARPGIDGRPVAEQEIRAGDHAAPGLVSPRGVAVDLHHEVPDSKFGTYEEVRAHTIPVMHHGRALRVPEPALLCAHVCEHVVRHHFLRPRYLPRHLADLASLRAAAGDGLWARANRFADPVSVRLSRALLEASRVSYLPRRALLPSPSAQMGLEAVWETLEAVGRVRRDLLVDPRRLGRKLVPAREFVAASYGTEPDDPKLPLLYAHRLVTFRWLLRPFRG